MAEEPNIPDVFRAYEEGKHRRYNLLFAVNGGAFAVAQLFFETTDSAESDNNVLEIPFFLGNLTALEIPFLGYLRLWQLSLGMALFTTVMVVDIFMFGENMRKKMPSLFGWQGKLVLTLIGLLIAVGWTLVSFGILVLALVILGYLGSIAAISIPPIVKKWLKIHPLPRKELKQLDEYMFYAENRRQIGEKQEHWDEFLRRVLAADFRISRAFRGVQSKENMIKQIRGDEQEREGPTDVRVVVEGNYGVVTSITKVKGDPNKYHHNFKAFERQPPGDWQCVYWRVTQLTRQ